MAIVHYRNKKTGVISAYESIAVYNPEKGYSTPIRKYLGRYDPETDTIIPSDGKRGRKPGTVAKGPGHTAQGLKTGRLEGEINALKKQIADLKAENKRLRSACESVYKAVSGIM